MKILNIIMDFFMFISIPQISNVTNPVFAAVQSQPNFQPSVLQHSKQNDTISPNALLHNAMSDITRFMNRKDFLLSRFVNFDDKPESYESWKASFQSVTRELGVTPFEEMDLLVKWLGPESCVCKSVTEEPKWWKVP
jgi:hypothetical protein